MYYYVQRKNPFRKPDLKKDEDLRIIESKRSISRTDYIEISEQEAFDYYEKEKREDEIRMSKRYLNDSDYKVIKCMEAFLTSTLSDFDSNIGLPYDIKSLIAERQEKRDKINELEQI